MRLVIRTKPGVVELNWMWAPTFIGLNTILKQELEQALAPRYKNREMSEETLDDLHQAIVDFLCERFPVDGLRDYLDAITLVADVHEAKEEN